MYEKLFEKKIKILTGRKSSVECGQIPGRKAKSQ